MSHPTSKGWRPQPDNKNDWIYEIPDNLTPLKSRDLRATHHLQTVPYNQGDMESCTAHAIASALRYGKNAEALGPNSTWMPSRMFIWYHERILNATNGGLIPADKLSAFLLGTDATVKCQMPDNSETTVSRAEIDKCIKANEGTFERYGFYILNKYGVCTEPTWDYLDKLADVAKPDFYTPPPNALTEADVFHNEAITYWRIKDLGEGAGGDVIAQMEAALTEGYPIVFGFWANDDKAALGPNQKGLDAEFEWTGWFGDGEEDWGHCVLCVGFDKVKKRFLILNSWGTAFGDGGYFYMPYKWFSPNEGMFVNKDGNSVPRCDDIWVVKSKFPEGKVPQ